MRDAIDRYKDLADRNQIRVQVGSEGYPPDLDTLVKGVAAGGAGATGIIFASCAAFPWTHDRPGRLGHALRAG